jgi:hypothetical protein
MPITSKLRIAILLSVPLLACLVPPVTSQQNQRLVVNNIKDKSLVEGCGCNFQLPLDHQRRSRKWVFADDLDGTAWMNIGGSDVRFKLTRTISAPEDQSKAKHGDRTVLEYKSGQFSLTITQTVTTPCPEGDDSCEWVGMNADIKLSDGKKTKRIRAIGGCGC